jgi:hypothetical protein
MVLKEVYFVVDRKLSTQKKQETKGVKQGVLFLIFLFETIWPIKTKLGRDFHWMVL